MAEKTNKLSNDWVRCKSKSRPDRYYLFNKKTGETNWCLDGEGNTHLKTVSAKDVVKTPAQDRMKRLQNQLEKKRLKEIAADSAKSSGRRSKKEEKNVDSISPKACSRPNEKESPSGSDKNEIPTSLLPNASKNTPQTVTKSSFKTPHNTPSSSKSSSVQKRLHNALKKSPEKPKSEESKAKELCKQNVVSVPPKRNKNSTSVQAASKEVCSQFENSKQSDRRIKETDQRTDGTSVECSESVHKSAEGCQTSVEVKVDIQAAKYDENKNQREAEGKSTFFSKIKVFCNNLINGTTKPNKRKPNETIDKEILSVKSKPSFKRKKLGNKSLLRGISCDILNESTDSSELKFEHSSESTSKAVNSVSVLNQSANSRLDRLRKSLQQQQSLHSLSPTSCLVPEESVSSPNVSECEPMDWQPISEDFNETPNSPSTSSAILADLSSVSEYNDTVSENIMRMAAVKKQVKHWKRDHFHFVIDTNVFIQNPTFVEELTTMKLCDTMGTVIYIPYCVLQELDKLKIRSPSESIRIRTTRAIKFLNKAFEERYSQFQAQSAAEEGNHLIKVTSPDDSILNCCLQVKKHVDNVLLLTEDVNLQSKAMCNDILVSTKSDLISLH